MHIFELFKVHEAPVVDRLDSAVDDLKHDELWELSSNVLRHGSDQQRVLDVQHIDCQVSG